MIRAQYTHQFIMYRFSDDILRTKTSTFLLRSGRALTKRRTATHLRCVGFASFAYFCTLPFTRKPRICLRFLFVNSAISHDAHSISPLSDNPLRSDSIPVGLLDQHPSLAFLPVWTSTDLVQQRFPFTTLHGFFARLANGERRCFGFTASNREVV